MARVPILDLPIHTFLPMQKGQPCLALIDGCPMLFKAKTPFAAHRAADDWRKAEIAKVEKARENAAKWVEAAKAAREQKKEAAE